MSPYSLAIRAIFFLVPVTAVCTFSALGADPKVVRVSHEAEAKIVTQDASEVKEAAQTNEDTAAYSPQWPEPPNTGTMLIRLCLGTFVVLALCVGTLWFGKPWLQKLQVSGAGNSALKIEGSVAVGNRAMLYLIRVGGTQLVAGTDITGLKSLIALPASFNEVLDEQMPEVDASVGPLSSFTPRTANRTESKE